MSHQEKHVLSRRKALITSAKILASAAILSASPQRLNASEQKGHEKYAQSIVNTLQEEQVLMVKRQK